MISTDTSANVIRETGVPQERDGADVRAPRAASLVILSGYLAMSGVLLGTDGHTTLAALHAAGVITDYRHDRLRIGFGLYHDEADVDELLRRLKTVPGWP